MKKLLLSVVALMVATLLFSLNDSNKSDEGVTNDQAVQLVKDANIAS